jgi:7-cyano-7-deazaguanine synthase
MKVVVLTSGGMDSTTLLHHHVKLGDEVRAIAFNYGQRHQKELSFAYLQATRLHVPLQQVNLSDLRYALPGSSQTDNQVAVPEGRYDEESMKLTVVPNRNMILLAVAIGHAIAHSFDHVSYAAHAGDHTIYPDCRPEFADAMEKVAHLCDATPIDLCRPFIEDTKADIVKRGINLGVDYSQTWSCYAGKDLHCGRCGTCYERIIAFRDAGVKDTTTYLDPNYALEKEDALKKTN